MRFNKGKQRDEGRDSFITPTFTTHTLRRPPTPRCHVSCGSRWQVFFSSFFLFSFRLLPKVRFRFSQPILKDYIKLLLLLINFPFLFFFYFLLQRLKDKITNFYDTKLLISCKRLWNINLNAKSSCGGNEKVMASLRLHNSTRRWRIKLMHREFEYFTSIKALK